MSESVNTSVRIPGELHQQLQREAERQDRSVNYLITQYVRRGLRQDQPGGLREQLGYLLTSIAGGGQVPETTTVERLKEMLQEADDRRFRGQW